MENKKDPLNLFLSDARSRAQTQDIDMLVFGNEAADLDSVVSAIGLAWMLGNSSNPCSALPLIPTKRDDFRLKTESRWVLSQTGIDTEHLFFIDDIQPGVVVHDTLIRGVVGIDLGPEADIGYDGFRHGKRVGGRMGMACQ